MILFRRLVFFDFGRPRRIFFELGNRLDLLQSIKSSTKSKNIMHCDGVREIVEFGLDSALNDVQNRHPKTMDDIDEIPMILGGSQFT